MKTRCMVIAVFCIFSFTLFPGISRGAEKKEFPEKEIRALVGFPPGSALELSFRAVTKVATKYVGKPLVVVNMPGGAQTIALNELAKSPADGYTVAMTTDGYKALTIHQQKVPFDPKVLKILMGYARFRHVLFIRADSPYAKYEDFVAYGQKNPGAIKYGGSGQGAAPDLLGKLFFKDRDIRATYIPFKGSNEYVQAVLGGHIMCGVVDISGVRQQVKAGKLKLVVAFGDQRLEEFPDVPSSKEKGHSDNNLLNSIICLTLHRDTPADRATFLHDAFKRAAEDPEFKRLTDDMGLMGVYVPPRFVEESILNTEKLGAPMLKELKLFLE